MAEPQQELTFNQFSVLANQIATQQRQIDALQQTINRILDDHEERIRRNETLIVGGFFLTVLATVVLFFLTRG